VERFRNLYSHKNSIPNELFLLKKAFRPEAPADPGPGAAADGPGAWAIKSLKVFVDVLARFPRPAVLDLGRVNGGNIFFLGSQGCRVLVNDFLGEREFPAPPGAGSPDADALAAEGWRKVLAGLEYPPRSVHGVICWDSLDHMPPAWAGELVKLLHRMLEPGGMILSLFGGLRPGGAGSCKGFRILDQDRIEPLPGGAGRPERHPYKNAEIMEVFSGFRVLDFCLLKGGYREILVQKGVSA